MGDELRALKEKLKAEVGRVSQADCWVHFALCWTGSLGSLRPYVSLRVWGI